MWYLKFILIFLMFSFEIHADQTDKRLDQLFQTLKISHDEMEMNTSILAIWNIWLETNDVRIEKDFKKGLQLMQEGKLQASIIMFTKVIEKKPLFAEAWNKRATVYYLLGDFDSSVMDIKETLILEPRHFGALDGLGLIFIHLKEYEKAIDIYDKMLKIFPYNLPTLRKRDKLMKLFSQAT